MFKANFRTAYLQREVPEDAIVLGDMVVGEMVEVDAATDVLPAVYSKLKATTVSAAIEEASHIIAQSDDSIREDQVCGDPEKYSSLPNLVCKNSEEKKTIAVYKIVDPDDIQLRNLG